MRWRRAAAGLTLAIALVGLLVYGVGWEAVLEHVGRADPLALMGAAVTGLGILLFRGLIVERLLKPIQGSARGSTFATAFLAGYFARSALPWGRSTGTPITAYLLAANSDSEFEDNLAVVATAELFGFAASLVIALVGLTAYVIGGSNAPQGLLASGALVGTGGLLVAGTVVLTVDRGWARPLLFDFALTCETAAGKLPRVNGIDGVLTRRLERLFSALERIGAARRTLVIAFGAALAGWVINALPLYFSLLALGVSAPLSIALLCAPLASFGGVLPLPGGTGGIEVVLASLLVATVGLTGDVATAAALLYRLTTYWLHLAISGAGAVYLSVSGRRVVSV
ncbi:flippase-like domain-containing protein [Natronorubrum sp. JWXQ-INN-674]|uniref:Flippase-like domain-containing protein n=1 Tax=Natronorubrum halalkaliphilum TaxID=2691917 RepID=A0A6B0VIN1_9EURY|nr:lysylphosphatidylglycerol synthase transmembrane domain-containing protein [Natronorubrum halalkaliphilum]MXV61711.1 flippase-like domain-containing protein [Natronorubrum halalkaliphilum]